MPFPTDTPHVIANRLAAADDDDKGACYLERPDATRIIVTVRAPHEKNESKISIPFDIWLKMIADHRRVSAAAPAPPGDARAESVLPTEREILIATIEKAADELTSLRTTNARMREALERGVGALEALRFYVETLERCLDPTIDESSAKIREHASVVREAIRTIRAALAQEGACASPSVPQKG